jgi:D-beta-D-heptose 7-phosphate kinase / D-beta-D-heptose 1-phosphate adenosyltransferase
VAAAGSDGVAAAVASDGVARVGAPGGVACIGPARAGIGGGCEDAAALARRVRASGGTVVATGGCFDLVHAGHVAVLEQARRLGDCLIVCLNSDASVTRLKGAGRPVQNESDRAAVLRALGAVDAVAVFDDDTPVRLLGALRPHLFVKGGDYAVGELPEARAMAAWGGQVVILPYLGGRSTTALLQRATRG